MNKFVSEPKSFETIEQFNTYVMRSYVATCKKYVIGNSTVVMMEDLHDDVSEVFYDNFNPDDWSVIVFSDDQSLIDMVQTMGAYCRFDWQTAKVSHPYGQFMAVGYHS